MENPRVRSFSDCSFDADSCSGFSSCSELNSSADSEIFNYLDSESGNPNDAEPSSDEEDGIELLNREVDGSISWDEQESYPRLRSFPDCSVDANYPDLDSSSDSETFSEFLHRTEGQRGDNQNPRLGNYSDAESISLGDSDDNDTSSDEEKFTYYTRPKIIM